MSNTRIGQHPILPLNDKEPLVKFTFNGQHLTAKKDEMISSALFANGIHVFGHHQRDGSPQGIFCANGQCAQCLVLADGLPVKSCIVPVEEGMEVRSMEGLPRLLAADEHIRDGGEPDVYDTEVLIVGGGPAGLTAALELGMQGVRCILCDDKNLLGGKLSLQTHNFFGSVKECFAGSRGMDIGVKLEGEVRASENIAIWTNSPVVGVFSDSMVGVVKNGVYTLVRPERILISAGAREKALAFPGADLPGVYGAGAFQTLVNRDLIRPAERLFIIGGGNVGLIAAYHALQAGIDVVGIVEALPECGGYDVHRDKLLRLGIPVYTSHTVMRAEGNEHVSRVIVTEIDGSFQPIPGTEAVFDVDTVLVAVGLASVNELYHEAKHAGMKVYSAGDAEEIAEASAAMFSGRITAANILRDMGKDLEIPPDWYDMQNMLRSKPGPNVGSYPIPPGMQVYPVIRCGQEIPCNPCTDVCPKGAITIPEGNLLGRPKLTGECIGCMKCIGICPGLAITLVDRRHDPSGVTALVTIPWEMPEGTVDVEDRVTTTGLEGEVVGTGKVVKLITGQWLNRRTLMQLEVPIDDADLVAGVRIREPLGKRAPTAIRAVDDGEVMICRCERVTRKQIVEYIRATGTRDLNALKAALRVGMGPCGGKTCTPLIKGIFRQEGIPLNDVEDHVERPFTQEIPLSAFLREVDE